VDSSPEEQASALAVAAEIKRERKNAGSRERRRKEKKAKKPKEPKIVEPADIQYQLKKFQEASRPTYAERREEQIANGAKPVPAKEKKYTSRVRIAFVECKGVLCTTRMAVASHSRFAFLKQESAEAAAAEYSADRGYACEAFLCEACSAINRRSIWHVRGKSRAVTVA
jgi:hypothetical protein